VPPAASASTAVVPVPPAGAAAGAEALREGLAAAEADSGGTDWGGGCDGGALGLKSSSTGRCTLSDFGSGSKATQPKPLNSTSGQAMASEPRTARSPWCVRKPTTTRVGRPASRASTAKAAVNCSEVPFWPPVCLGPKRKYSTLG